MDMLKRLDLYKQMPSDLVKGSSTGGSMSIAAVLIMSWLFLNEFWSYLTVKHETHIMVEAPKDTGKVHAEIEINMNITMLRVPCAVMSVDAQDIMGSHVLDVGGELHKTRTDTDGNVKLDARGQPLPLKVANAEMVGEGCRVHGHMIVKKVPGNFHISCHTHSELIATFFGSGTVNVSHIIHDLSFGTEESAAQITTVDETVVNPLAGSSKMAIYSSNDKAQSYEYFINVVPTDYLSLSGRLFESYQFSANSNEIVGRYRIPAVYFRYELTAVTVIFKETATSFAHFIVQACAIVGGIFTALGLLNGAIITTTKKFKGSINKLG